MRLPGASDSDSDDDYPESKSEDITRVDDENFESVSPTSSIMNLAFRGIRRGMNIDCQDDDGNWYAAEVRNHLFFVLCQRFT